MNPSNGCSHAPRYHAHTNPRHTFNWIHPIFHVHHIGIIKCSAYMENAIHSLHGKHEGVCMMWKYQKKYLRIYFNSCKPKQKRYIFRLLTNTHHYVRQEGIPKPFSFSCSFDKPCNITNLQKCWNFWLGLVQLTQPTEAVIRNVHTSLQNMPHFSGHHIIHALSLFLPSFDIHHGTIVSFSHDWIVPSLDQWYKKGNSQLESPSWSAHWIVCSFLHWEVRRFRPTFVHFEII